MKYKLSGIAPTRRCGLFCTTLTFNPAFRAIDQPASAKKSARKQAQNSAKASQAAIEKFSTALNWRSRHINWNPSMAASPITPPALMLSLASGSLAFQWLEDLVKTDYAISNTSKPIATLMDSMMICVGHRIWSRQRSCQSGCGIVEFGRVGIHHMPISSVKKSAWQVCRNLG